MKPAGVRLTALIAAALAVRLLLASVAWRASPGGAVFATGDSPEYIGLAESLASAHRFHRASGPELYRPPGYPLLLVPGVVSGWLTPVTIVLQALLSGLIVWLTWAAARRLFPPRVAFACAALAAFEPGLILYSDKIGAETLLATCLAATALALVTFLENGRDRWLIAAGALTAAAAYAKPVAMFLPWWTAATLALVIPGPRRWRAPAVYLAAALACLAPWHARNAIAGGYYGFSTQMDGVLAQSAPSAVTAVREGRTFAEVRVRADVYRFTGPVSDPSYAAARRRGIATLLASPLTYARIHLAGMFRTLVDPGGLPYVELFGQPDRALAIARIISDRGSVAGLAYARRADPPVFLLTLALMLALLPFLALPAAGVWRWRRAWRPAHLVLLSLVTYQLIVSGGPWGQSRFRQPMMPWLSILAGFALVAPRPRARLEADVPSR